MVARDLGWIMKEENLHGLGGRAVDPVTIRLIGRPIATRLDLIMPSGQSQTRGGLGIAYNAH